jgi:2-methylcitrate dehydratase PrpD
MPACNHKTSDKHPWHKTAEGISAAAVAGSLRLLLLLKLAEAIIGATVTEYALLQSAGLIELI